VSEKIIRICNISKGLQMILLGGGKRMHWVMAISPDTTKEIRKSGIRDARKMRIPYETKVYTK